MSAGLTEKLSKPIIAKPSFWPALATLFFGSFVGMYHVVSLNVSLPGFIGIFHTDLGKVQWIITGFSLACGVIAPASGYAGDRFGVSYFAWRALRLPRCSAPSLGIFTRLSPSAFCRVYSAD
ncbi:MFS family permease [Paenibacillus endophyticus]|uniref:MFS family permease n=1 Tax=Paenibacillus endophyticus TaxID=1294268 RepID=A0A7W5C9H4_9BACL|nr:hypothetical protein [Paenibacillus endophyticus]MBB3153180.1 MFS family permease [Paenibacillus endophyticus]